MLDRRSFLAATASGLGAALVAAPPSDVSASLAHAHLAGQGQAPAFQVFTAEQAADIEAIAAQVIPSEPDYPGAREARVVYFIDHSLQNWAAGQRAGTLAGLGLFNAAVMERHPGKRFSQLTPAEQLAFLTANERHQFFQQIRFPVIIGMFAHPQWRGNFEGAGYRAIGFEPRFVWQPPFGEYDAEATRGRGVGS